MRDSAARVARLREELKAARARRLRRAARRPAPERICAGERRAARLAHRLHRLGRRRGRAGRPRRCVRRRPLHRAGGGAGRHKRVRRSSIWSRTPPERMARAESARRRSARLRPLAAHRRGRGEAEQGLRRRPARAGRRSRPIRSTRSGATGRRRRSGRSRCATSNSPAKARADKLARIRAEIASCAPTRCVVSRSAQRRLDLQHPRRRRRAYAAGARLRADPARGQARALHRSGASSTNEVRARARRRSPTCATPATLDRRSRGARRSARPCGSTRRPRADALVAPSSSRPAARPMRGADPITLMKAVKNAAEIAGARAAHLRDGAAVARFLAWLDREAPKGKLDRDRRRRGAGELPPRHRRC